MGECLICIPIPERYYRVRYPPAPFLTFIFYLSYISAPPPPFCLDKALSDHPYGG